MLKQLFFLGAFFSTFNLSLLHAGKKKTHKETNVNKFIFAFQQLLNDLVKHRLQHNGCLEQTKSQLVESSKKIIAGELCGLATPEELAQHLLAQPLCGTHSLQSIVKNKFVILTDIKCKKQIQEAAVILQKTTVEFFQQKKNLQNQAIRTMMLNNLEAFLEPFKPWLPKASLEIATIIYMTKLAINNETINQEIQMVINQAIPTWQLNPQSFQELIQDMLILSIKNLTLRKKLEQIDLKIKNNPNIKDNGQLLNTINQIGELLQQIKTIIYQAEIILNAYTKTVIPSFTRSAVVCAEDLILGLFIGISDIDLISQTLAGKNDDTQIKKLISQIKSPEANNSEFVSEYNNIINRILELCLNLNDKQHITNEKTQFTWLPQNTQSAPKATLPKIAAIHHTLITRVQDHTPALVLGNILNNRKELASSLISAMTKLMNSQEVTRVSNILPTFFICLHKNTTTKDKKDLLKSATDSIIKSHLLDQQTISCENIKQDEQLISQTLDMIMTTLFIGVSLNAKKNLEHKDVLKSLSDFLEWKEIPPYFISTETKLVHAWNICKNQDFPSQEKMVEQILNICNLSAQKTQEA